MKKLLILLGVVATATVSQASYLYWQVSSAPEGLGTVTGYNLVVVNASDGSTVSTATSYFYNQSSDSYASVSKETAGATQVASATAAEGVYADIGTYNSSSYSYYIEVIGYSSTAGGSTANTNIGQSNMITYANAQGSIVGGFDEIASAQSMTAITGTSYSAPEPTSGLLLLVGGALLALRRRRA